MVVWERDTRKGYLRICTHYFLLKQIFNAPLWYMIILVHNMHLEKSIYIISHWATKWNHTLDSPQRAAGPPSDFNIGYTCNVKRKQEPVPAFSPRLLHLLKDLEFVFWNLHISQISPSIVYFALYKYYIILLINYPTKISEINPIELH